MNLTNYTEKAREALISAQRIAEEHSHSQLEPEHLLLALTRQPEGVVPRIFERLNIAPTIIASEPELLNRIDEVVIFEPLGREQIAEIVEIQLRDLRQRLAERTMTLELTSAAKQRLADIDYDPVYGARPLRRAIQQRIIHPLAVRLLAGDFHDGDTILVDTDGQQFTFTATSRQEPMGMGT